VADYRARFTDLATEFILSLPKRRQRAVLDQARQLARYPFVASDYRLPDDDGHEIDHLLINGLVFSYWVDHANQTLLITEIEDADTG
jgi:hypothetical protein